MNPLQLLLLVTLILLGQGGAQAGAIAIDLRPDQANPTTPTMGDWIHFHSQIHNTGSQPIDGLVAWISLVEVTPGREQPMDLEDWSAHKAVSGATLAPGAALGTEWPLRLIQSGDYGVVISATDRNARTVYTSPMQEFHVASKAVVESSRILPVALGLPLVIAGRMGYRGWRRRGD
jgi:hypothetical protein